MKVLNTDGCQLEDVAAYLDGELSGIALDTFEAHLQKCSDCTVALRTQRQLLCTLDSAFSESDAFHLPHDFSRVVAAHAENDLSVMHKQSERRRAVQLCAVLALVSFALLGAATRTLVLDPVRSFFRVSGSLINLLWQTVYELGAGLAVIIRVIGRAAGPSPNGWWLFVGLVLVISVSLLPLLIVKYHRTQITE
jgi:anti-sigma factor RsiW